MTDIVFTLCSNNYLAHAKTLGDSLRVTNPQVHFVIGLVDKRHPEIDYDFFKPSEIIEYHQIGFPIFEEMILRYNVIEFNTAVKPFYFEFLLMRYGNGSKVYYVDPDIVFYQSLAKLSTILDRSNIVLTPMLSHASAEVTTDELVALRHGMYNLGFIGVSHSDESFRFLRWWQERLIRHCIIDKPKGLFVDQKWIDIAPLFFDGIQVLKDPGYNMAWWNFAERKLLKSGEQNYVNSPEHELIFFHFSGYKVGRDYYTGRLNNADYAFKARPELQELFKDYSERLILNQYKKFEQFEPLLKFVPLKKKPKGLMTKMKDKVKSRIRSFL